MANRGYKRSWKNLLINKRYQLSFTLLMVGLATLLIGGLGIFVMHVANETTQVSQTSARRPCPQVPVIEAPHKQEMPAPPADAPATEPQTATEPHGTGKIVITLEPMKVPEPVLIVPPVPDNFTQSIVDHYTCELEITNEVNDLENGRLLILYVLIGTGALLVLGLAFYGIKMTHRVAGPLFKVQLYLAKMKAGRLDKVYNLRKGDQLVEFYDHFKAAHEGIVKREQDDLARLREVIAAAEAAGAGEHPAIGELRALVARKEKSLE